MKRFELFIVLVTIAAWFAISNHCALNALESPKIASVHVSCHGAASARGKVPVKGEKTPCCKTLRALAIKPFAGIGGVIPGAYKPFAYPTAAGIIVPQRIALRLLPLETGPPGRATFAELVLHRSVLAHAPPSLV